MRDSLPTAETVTDLKRENVGENDGQFHHGGSIHDPIVQVVIAVSCAIVVSLTVLVCIICVKRKRDAMRRKSSIGHFFMGAEAPSPFGYTSVQSQLFRSGDGDKKENVNDTFYRTFSLTEEYPQEELSEIDHSDRSSTASGSEVCDLTDSPQSDKSSQNLYKISAVKKLRLMRRAKSMGNLPMGLASGVINRAESETTMTLFLEYLESNSVLNIDIQDVMDIPSRCQFSDVYIVANLLPFSNEAVTSKDVPVDEVTYFNEILQFSHVTPKDLEQCTIRLSLFSKKKSKSKSNFVGETFIHCSEIDTKIQSPTKLEVVLQRKRLKKFSAPTHIPDITQPLDIWYAIGNEAPMGHSSVKSPKDNDKPHSTAEKHLTSNLGEVFVLLQYNGIANRMKVFIRRAEHLPKSDRLLRQPVHYIMLNIYKDGELVMTKETKTQSGYSPVWNQPFLFDIPNPEVSEYSLELVLMRGRLYSKDGVIGRIIIGKNAPKTGCDHWHEMIRPSAHEVAKWHNIMPVFRFE